VLGTGVGGVREKTMIGNASCDTMAKSAPTAIVREGSRSLRHRTGSWKLYFCNGGNPAHCALLRQTMRPHPQSALSQPGGSDAFALSSFGAPISQHAPTHPGRPARSHHILPLVSGRLAITMAALSFTWRRRVVDMVDVCATACTPCVRLGGAPSFSPTKYSQGVGVPAALARPSHCRRRWPRSADHNVSARLRCSPNVSTPTTLQPRRSRQTEGLPSHDTMRTH
jgi:hypothetical protein